jgi:glutamyl-tRNA reductase
VLLHTPSVRARELARQGDAQAFIDGAAALFGVDVDAEAAARPRLTAVDDESAAS